MNSSISHGSKKVVSSISGWASALEKEINAGAFTYLKLCMLPLNGNSKKIIVPKGCGLFKESKIRPAWKLRTNASSKVECFLPPEMLEEVVVIGYTNRFDKLYYLVEGGERIIKADYIAKIGSSEFGPFTEKDFVKP